MDIKYIFLKSGQWIKNIYSCNPDYESKTYIGRFAPIFYLNCEHVHCKANQAKSSRILQKNLMKIELCWRNIFVILIIIKPSLGPIGSAVLTFIGYKQTDRQTEKQSVYIYRFVIRALDLEYLFL